MLTAGFGFRFGFGFGFGFGVRFGSQGRTWICLMQGTNSSRCIPFLYSSVGCRFDVATTTAPSAHIASNRFLRMTASPTSVT